MDQKTGAKILAAFLALLMVVSIFPYFLGGSGPPQDVQNNQFDNDIQYDNFNVGGQLIEHSFNSIEDALQMSPPDTYSAYYIDVDYINETTSQPWYEVLNPYITTAGIITKNEVDNFYQSSGSLMEQTSTQTMYFAELPDDNFVLLSTMTPKRVFFSYTAVQSQNGRYMVLIRENGMANIMGDPTLLAPSRNLAESILSLIEGVGSPSTAYDTFGPLLDNSDDNSEFQLVTSQVDFADQYYLGISYLVQYGNFTRTTIYKNPTAETSSYIQQLARTGSNRGFSQYDVRADGDILKVVITGQFQDVISEDIKKQTI